MSLRAQQRRIFQYQHVRDLRAAFTASSTMSMAPPGEGPRRMCPAARLAASEHASS
ncbi:hypothetical protein BV133_2924 [Blastochloris viridis]|uniref:Uncharacterized protein n=1 Tax=Blastochloris viridis TaxID=1079 RepID=A0A182D6E2_BLAVI|nr:hypothetical protein BV133_2924 [Blastochloris viridis]